MFFRFFLSSIAWCFPGFGVCGFTILLIGGGVSGFASLFFGIDDSGFASLLFGSDDSGSLLSDAVLDGDLFET